MNDIIWDGKQNRKIQFNFKKICSTCFFIIIIIIIHNMSRQNRNKLNKCRKYMAFYATHKR